LDAFETRRVKTAALLARKGGAGKTTVAIHLGVLAHTAGQRVVFFDLDPQRSLALWWQNRAADSPALVETDARRLPDLLRDAAAEGYDLAVVDTLPAVTFDTARVAGVADLVLIPLRPSLPDLYAVEGTAAVVKTTRTPALLVLNACLPPRETGEATTTTEARKALESVPVPVAETSISQRLDYSRALNSGEAVNEFAPGSRAAVEIERLWREVERRLS
jgi:chromosome partitioning protein